MSYDSRFESRKGGRLLCVGTRRSTSKSADASEQCKYALIINGLMTCSDSSGSQQSLWCDCSNQWLYRIPVLVLSVQVSFEECGATSFEVEQ